MRNNVEFSICSNDGVFDVALHVHVQVYSNGRVTWTPPALYCSSCGVKVTPDLICQISLAIYGISSIGRIFSLRLAELLHAVPLLHLRLDRNRHAICPELKRPGDQGGPAGWGFHWYLFFLWRLVYAHSLLPVTSSSILNISAEGGEWYIKHRPSRKVMLDDEYEGMVFYLIIERKPLYYVLNIILPCILITIIAIFNFYLPPDAGIPNHSLIKVIGGSWARGKFKSTCSSYIPQM